LRLLPLDSPDSSFYSRPTKVVARELLGKTLVRLIVNTMGQLTRISGIIVETEAYGFRDDPASHAYRGLTVRNNAMFGGIGRAYVYFTYGNHFCINVTARSHEIKAGAVLIRALQPLEGIDLMKCFRKTDNLLSLTSGPGKVTQALNITRALNQEDMTNIKSKLHIEFGIDVFDIVTTRRIGITRALDKTWRFVVGHGEPTGYLNRYASRKQIKV
jgi:DNA-3-methyladenine glycosylase